MSDSSKRLLDEIYCSLKIVSGRFLSKFDVSDLTVLRQMLNIGNTFVLLGGFVIFVIRSFCYDTFYGKGGQPNFIISGGA